MPKPKKQAKKSCRLGGKPKTGADPASFDKTALEAIHGRYPESFGRPHVVYREYHHCLGRGQEFGAKKNHPLRHIFSSVLNAIPLDRASHKEPGINDHDLRCLFLDKAMARVMNSDHVWEEKDHLFLALATALRKNPRQPQLIRSLFR